MSLKIRAWSDFLSGLLFIVIGTGFAVVASGYDLGTANQMGPGYFPFGLGCLLAILGIAVLLSSLSLRADEHGIDKIDLRVIFFVIGPMILFALFLDKLGFVASLFIVTLGSSFACRELRWHTALSSAIVLVSVSLVIFVVLLKVQVDLWPAYLN